MPTRANTHLVYKNLLVNNAINNFINVDWDLLGNNTLHWHRNLPCDHLVNLHLLHRHFLHNLVPFHNVRHRHVPGDDPEVQLLKLVNRRRHRVHRPDHGAHPCLLLEVT